MVAAPVEGVTTGLVGDDVAGAAADDEAGVEAARVEDRLDKPAGVLEPATEEAPELADRQLVSANTRREARLQTIWGNTYDCC